MTPEERYAATRDRFAAVALKVLFAEKVRQPSESQATPADIASAAYAMAELMMSERAELQQGARRT